MKRKIALLMVLVMILSVFTACNNGTPKETDTATPEQTAEPSVTTDDTDKPSAADDELYIAVISKGFQHQFWQTVLAGAQAAADKYGVEMTFEGPASESDISDQVDMLNAAMAKNPSAICLAALDTDSVNAQLEECLSKSIPVICFDSGVPDAPAGSILSTASTDNYAAGEMAAEEMFKEASFKERLESATADNPVAIAVQSQDATSASILNRTNGFIDKMVELAGGVHSGGVEVTGHDVFKKAADGDVVVSIVVAVPPTTEYTDCQATAQTTLQNTENLIGYFCSNEASVTGILAATNDGTDLDRESGTYKDLIVIGFDAGAPQKTAVENQYLYGSIAQDAYMIGYYAVELAYKSIKGESIDEIVDTGCVFYSYANMADSDVAQLLYD